MAEVIYVDKDGKVEGKFKRFCRETKEKAKAFVETCKENKEQVVAVAAIAVPAVTETVKLIAKNRNRQQDNDKRYLEMWDPVEGHHWKLRRKLKTSEYLEVERRVKNGESRGEVLDDMGLLRK